MHRPHNKCQHRYSNSFLHMTQSLTVAIMSKIFPQGTSRKEITEHWEWLEHNLLQTLSIFENENDITTFVKGKVQVSNIEVGVDICTWT